MSAESKSKCFLCGRDAEIDRPSGHHSLNRYVCAAQPIYILL